ncbi:phosphodiester glycosidase family protein [Actinacidiphila glaucinigra]|uniref:phosphodiester glycosidase family protein n=1 Tax=Actinacidiphila glaucinigra TaxID=235986 RepID=UPI0035D93031
MADHEVPSRTRRRSALGTTLALAVLASFGLYGAARILVPPADAATPSPTHRQDPAGTTRDAPVPPGRWTVRTLAPGVEVRTGVITNAGAHHSWTVAVSARATGRVTGAKTWAAVGSRDWAGTTARDLRTAGFRPRVETVLWPRYSDTPQGEMGRRVRVGSYGTEAAAARAAARVRAAGFHADTTWTGYDVEEPADRQNVHVVVVDPRKFTGTVTGTYDGDVARPEKVSAVARKTGSLVGVNGGFFVDHSEGGRVGTPAAVGAEHGRLEAMAVGSRAALVLGDGGRRARVTDLTTVVTVRAGAAGRQAQGINRVPGTARNCGRPGGVPSALPWQGVICRLPDDMVVFTPSYKAPLPTGPGLQVVLDASGRVVSRGPRGGSVPARGQVLQGLGTAADWLRAHAPAGAPLTVDRTIRDAQGRRVVLGPDDSIVSAAPTLVSGGRIAIDAATEGCLDPADLSLGYVWSAVRQPRTMAGVDARGRLILATVDGRRAGGSEGFTFYESAVFMRSLGAVDALNLDGGGSSAIAVKGALANRPSDAVGERRVGGSIQVLPAAAR